MEAARVLSLRGHRVSLYEKGDPLGGLMWLASRCPGREEFAAALDYYLYQLSILGVEVCLGKEMTAETIQELPYSAVVIAIGGNPIVPAIPGISRPQVITAAELLSGKKPAVGRVVVLGGGMLGVESAIFDSKQSSMKDSVAPFLMSEKALSPEESLELAHEGKEVTLITRRNKLWGRIRERTHH